MGLRKKEDVEVRTVTYSENIHHHSYTIPIGDELAHLGKVRSCCVVGDKLVINVNRVEKPVAPFPTPTDATFIPKFK